LDQQSWQAANHEKQREEHRQLEQRQLGRDERVQIIAQTRRHEKDRHKEPERISTANCFFC
jgi:hypothetical protein